jgi:hypothetical protein
MFVRDDVLQVELSVEECKSALDEWKVTHGKVAREAKGKEIVDRLAVYEKFCGGYQSFARVVSAFVVRGVSADWVYVECGGEAEHASSCTASCDVGACADCCCEGKCVVWC